MKRVLSLAALLALTACDSVTFVDRLIIVNPTDYSVLVEVRGPDDPSWLDLGIAERDTEHLNEHVIDMGETWVFRFRYATEELGEESISRRELEDQRWRYTIPDRVGITLGEKGYEPSPE